MSRRWVQQYKDDHFDKRLSDYGFARGDLVLYSCGQDETGGVIFQIYEDTAPVKPHAYSKLVTRKRQVYNAVKRDYEYQDVEENEAGYFDDKGRKIMNSAVAGFVRIKPLFEFFATPKGKSPKGKGETLIITYDMLKQLRKVDLVVLGAKYVELGNLLRDLAMKGGMEGDGSR
jgi:hypothetical protein